ncbi:MAG: sulfite exporter TauE/SafE family protein [Myxococcaceae bacterium]|nr:sulfite exporter TauE/SafE family protein [Myxococcaceae bacterium]
MTSPLVIAGASSALVAGATGSLHCALMCGPLACAGVPQGPGRRAAMVAWNVGRLSGYVAVGLLLGSVGVGIARALSVSVQPYLPWVMAAGLIATALELGKHLRPLPVVRSISRALVRASGRLDPTRRSFVMGLATPFLPCGLLYGVFLAAIATGSPLGGASLLGAFALGAIPALATVQAGSGLATRWPSVTWALRKAVPLFAAGVLIYRAVLASTQGPDCH